MKYIFITLIFLSTWSNVICQSVVGHELSSQSSIPGVRAAPNNFWFGSTTIYQISEDPELANNLLPVARGTFPVTSFQIKGKELMLPTVFNVGVLRDLASDDDTEEEVVEEKINEILSSSQGIQLGLNPYIELYRKSDNKIAVTTHGYMGVKINSFELEENIKYLWQGRFSFGVDFSIGANTPIVISLDQVFTIFSKEDYFEIFDESKSGTNHFYGEIILPIGSGIGGVFNFHYNKNTGLIPGFGFVFSTN